MTTEVRNSLTVGRFSNHSDLNGFFYILVRSANTFYKTRWVPPLGGFLAFSVCRPPRAVMAVEQRDSTFSVRTRRLRSLPPSENWQWLPNGAVNSKYGITTSNDTAILTSLKKCLFRSLSTLKECSPPSLFINHRNTPLPVEEVLCARFRSKKNKSKTKNSRCLCCIVLLFSIQYCISERDLSYTRDINLSRQGD